MNDPEGRASGVLATALVDRLRDAAPGRTSARQVDLSPPTAANAIETPLNDAMAALAHMPLPVAVASGAICLLLAVILDAAARDLGVRLVPVYVPILCVICWALGRWLAVLFAIVTAFVAILPDIIASPVGLGLATAANAGIRATSYIFLALIIVAYRRSYDRADLRAMYDGLTGVLNKMPFHAAVARHVIEARRTRRTLLIAFVDLDEFKAINTVHGHSAGDAALRCFSQEALSAIRGSDAVGRLGGDEFGFVLDAASGHDAEALAHVLHQRLTTTLAKTGLPLSCSMGGLIVPPHATLPEDELIDAADALMMEAKTAGKSIVITHHIERPLHGV